MICPLCGAPVVYQGLTSLECEGRECLNRSKDILEETVESILERLKKDLESLGMFGLSIQRWGASAVAAYHPNQSMSDAGKMLMEDAKKRIQGLNDSPTPQSSS